MLSPRWLKVGRDLTRHRARTALVVAAIAVGIGGAGATLDTWALLRRVTTAGYLATNPPSAILRTERIDADLLAQVRALPGVAAAEARRTVLARARVADGWRTAVLFAPADPNALTIGRVVTEAGWPPADSGLVIERSSAEYAGAVIGHPIEVQIGDGPPLPLPVTGLARDQGLAPGWMEHTVYAFVSPGTLARLGAPGTFDQLRIVVADRSLGRDSVRRIAAQVQRAVGATGRAVTAVEVPDPGEHVHAAQMNSLLATQGAFGLLALLLSGLLVVNLIGAMLVGQIRDIGVMKAVGARQADVARLYLGVAAGLGLVASAIAVPAAAAAGRGYAAFVAEALNFELGSYGIPWWAFALQLGVGLVMPVAAAAIPVRRGTAVSVGAALRDQGMDEEPAAGWRLAGLGRAGRPLLLALRNPLRRRRRTLLTIIALASGGAIYLAALDLRVAISRSVDLLYGERMRWDLVVRFRTPHPADRLEASIGGETEVAAAEGWTGIRATVTRPEGTQGNTFAVTGLPAGSRLVAYPVTGGRWLAPGDSDAVVVTERLVHDEPGLALGDTVTLVAGGRPVRRRVVGVVNAGPAATAYAERAAVAALLGRSDVQTVMVRAASREPAAQAALARRLRARLDDAGTPVAEIQLMAEARTVLEDHLLLVAETLLMLARLALLVAGLGLASTMSLAVLERTREIGVLRAVGARHGAIHALIHGEGLAIGLASWLVAVPLSLPISVGLGQVFGRIMLEVPITWVPEGGPVIRWLIAVVVLSVAASAWPAVRATRVPAARALAYE